MKINSRLLQRVTRPLNQPGIMNHRMADRLIERYERLVNRLPLLDQQMSRWSAIANLETEQVPIVYAQTPLEEGETPTPKGFPSGDAARTLQPQTTPRESDALSPVTISPSPPSQPETPFTNPSPQGNTESLIEAKLEATQGDIEEIAQPKKNLFDAQVQPFEDHSATATPANPEIPTTVVYGEDAPPLVPTPQEKSSQQTVNAPSEMPFVETSPHQSSSQVGERGEKTTVSGNGEDAPPLVPTQPESQSQHLPLLQLAVQPTPESIIQAKYDTTASLTPVFTPVKAESPWVASEFPTSTQSSDSFETLVCDLPLTSQTSIPTAHTSVTSPQLSSTPLSSPIQRPAFINLRQNLEIIGDRAAPPEGNHPLVENPVTSPEIAPSWPASTLASVTENQPLDWITPDTPILAETPNPASPAAHSNRETTATVAPSTGPSTPAPVVIPKKAANTVSAFPPQDQKQALAQPHLTSLQTSTSTPVVFAQRPETLTENPTEKATNSQPKPPTVPLTFPTTQESAHPANDVTTPLTQVEPEMNPAISALPTIQIDSQLTPPTLETLVLSHAMKPQADSIASTQKIHSSTPTTAHPIPKQSTEATVPRSPPSTQQNPPNASPSGQQAQSATKQTVTQNAPPEINLDALVAKVERKVLRRLVVESERRGKHKWR
ncbi:hypothetical protein PN462_19395 [Spirulina sp. CS-785/01]|uniref:hypothetical protein n=1 Tax=Spirulina sp. CS-785/01 TaxID=3021716 RepID=UPI00232EEB1E|nr:hypothetical protein [Spirulina sp. CS-785/01]MDB9315289.1 hypothetical protein [Spirulina sp. CS-785/01]